MATRKRQARPSRTLATLRRRLREAEDTLNAIRDGHVEALVVHAPEGEQIFTLRSADQPFRLMVEQMREGALTVASDGTIVYCNQRFAELAVSAPERITGRPFTEFVTAECQPTLLLLLNADSYRAEVQLRTATGDATPAQLSSIALNIDGMRTVAVVVTDLTHERTERGLRESNRLKDEFLATLSHELRTPLNVILGWTRMLLAGQLSDTAQTRALELIDRNARAQAQLVNDLVDMSRMTTGKLQVELEPLPLIPVLDSALEGVRPSAEMRQIAITTAWHVGDLNVMADATRLQQVLWNLLSNAVKFTPPGGRITVSASEAGGRVQIDITDTGIGIEPSFLPHVFDRFRQADSTATRRHGGLGLGLAIVHDLVALHGGDVAVRSAGPDQGSTFTVGLRASTQRERDVVATTQPSQAVSLGRHRVLVVEDHDDTRELFVEALRGARATVDAFSNTGAALAAISHVRPTVVIADIGLPGEDGYALIRRIRAHSDAAVRLVPAIAVTAYATAADGVKALAAGFQQHLPKPLDPERLVQAIHDLPPGNPDRRLTPRDRGDASSRLPEDRDPT